MKRLLALLPAVSLLACTEKPADTDSGDPRPPWVLGEVVDQEGPGTLATLTTPWGEQIYLLRVEGSHYEMGYQYGRLAGPLMMDLWWTYMTALGGEMGLDAETADTTLSNLMDEAWLWFGPNTPQPFLDEFQGVGDGMVAAGVEYGEGPEDVAKVPIRIVTLIDLAMSSKLDPENIFEAMDFLDNGYTDELLAWYGRTPARPTASVPARESRPDEGDDRSPLFNCSFFAAWGDRTDDGGQYVTRNMDFAADTGIYKQAMLTAYVPDGGVPYVSIGWLGATLGALGGVSREGISVGAVGASSPYERMNTEPAVLRAREALENATDLASAMPYLENSVGDGIIRAPTIGYNALVAWGDPRNDGADAQAVILESNGLETGVHHHKNDCSVDAALMRFSYEGDLESTWTPDDHPEWANQEATAQEISADGAVRLFVVDETGNYVEDAAGEPVQTGYPEPCALYRGDEAMTYGVRVHQTAANGPAEGGTGLMVHSGSWRNRYWPSREMTRAWASGTAFDWDGVNVIPDNGGVPVPIGIDETEAVARVAAMDSNVWAAVIDTTDLVLRVSWESGTGDSWVRAADQAEFLEIQLEDLFLVE